MQQRIRSRRSVLIAIGAAIAVSIASWGLISARSTPTATTDRDRLAAWSAQTLPLIEDAKIQMAAMDMADPSSQASALTPAYILEKDIRSLQAFDPAPDEAVNFPWQQALAAFANGCRLYIDGTKQDDSFSLGLADGWFAKGSGHLNAATAAFEARV